jgi:hypothetical protein
MTGVVGEEEAVKKKKQLVSLFLLAPTPALISCFHSSNLFHAYIPSHLAQFFSSTKDLDNPNMIKHSIWVAASRHDAFICEYLSTTTEGALSNKHSTTQAYQQSASKIHIRKLFFTRGPQFAYSN